MPHLTDTRGDHLRKVFVLAEDKKAMRRRQILMAALEAFSEKGFDKTSVNDIVNKSGLSKGTLYWYFDNKQAIFIGMVEMIFEDILGYYHNALAETQDLPPPERLRKTLTGMDMVVDEMMKFAGLYADFFAQAWQTEEIRVSLKRLYENFIDPFVPVIQEGIDKGYFREVDAHQAAVTILGALDGYWFQQILEVGDAQAAFGLHADLVIRGLMKDDQDET